MTGGEATNEERPIPGPPVLGVTGEVAILHELLEIERKRLAMAHQMEADRNIVFPETTVIVRDVIRLTSMIRAKEVGANTQEAEPADADDPLDRMLREMNT